MIAINPSLDVLPAPFHHRAGILPFTLPDTQGAIEPRGGNNRGTLGRTSRHVRHGPARVPNAH